MTDRTMHDYIILPLIFFGNLLSPQTLYLLSGYRKRGGEANGRIGGGSIRQRRRRLSEKHEQSKDDFLIQEIKDNKLNMFRVAKSILHNDSDAEDAVSESILTAYTALFTLKNRDSFKPWVMKILVRECYKIIKTRSSVDYLDELPDIPVHDADNTQVLWGYVNSLPHEYRSAVVLFYYEDMSIKAIAQTLSISQGTVKSRLSRGKARLKQLIEKNGGFGYDGF